MTLEEKIKYYNYYYEENGLPEGIKAEDFFDLDMINYLKEEGYPCYYIKDIRDVLLSESSYKKMFVELIIRGNSQLEGGNFADIFIDDNVSKVFMDIFIDIVSVDKKSVKNSYLNNILSNDKLRKLFMSYDVDISDSLKSIQYARLSNEVIAELLGDKKVVNLFLNFNYLDFFSFVESTKMYKEFNELIKIVLQRLSYKEKIDLLERRYNKETNKPDYLSELYLEFEDVLKKRKVRSLITSVVGKPTPENIELVRNIINTPEGMDILLGEILEPTFSEIVNVLNLDRSIYESKRNTLLERLHNYKEYDLNTIRDVLCLYCFNDNSNNIRLRLKTIIEYTNENEEVLNELLDDMPYIIRLMKFLSDDKLDMNPLELISNLDIDGIIRRLHVTFSDDVNKKTDISDYLNRDTKEVDGVRVIDVDIPLDRSYFIVHSVSKDSIGDNPKDKYIESAKKHGRLCTSVLDNNHTGTYLEGVVFGYCNIGMPLYSVVPFDGQTNQRMQVTGRPQYRSVLSSVDRLCRRTMSKYNELTYLTNNEVLMPDYIFVADREPNDLDIRVAKAFNIPIVVYHTKEIDYQYEEGYSRGEGFIYEKHTLDYVPSGNIQELRVS
ncbi:MAG: hypothetical protein IKQ29_01580 [Bacilli bacterium]|nr:hypothetical protein [Bacilli bacterium]